MQVWLISGGGVARLRIRMEIYWELQRATSDDDRFGFCRVCKTGR